MSKILIIGDLHGKKSNLDTIRVVLTKCKLLASKCDRTVLLGDLNDSKAIIRSEILRLYIEFFENWPTLVDICVGNHDYENSIECKGHSLESLKKVNRVSVHDICRGQAHRFYIPYMPEKEFISIFSTISIPAQSVVFMHQDMKWCKYSEQTPTRSIIDSSMFTRCKRVFSGHIHLAQERDNIVYVGTPYTESFKESGDEKSVIIYDDSTDKMIRIPLPGVPKHITLKYMIQSLEDIINIKKDLKDKLSDKDNTWIKSLITRVIISAPEEIYAKVKKSLFIDYPISLKTEKISTANKDIQISEIASNNDIIEAYLKQLDLKDDILSSVLKINRSILKEVEGVK
jgi:predicted phosphodiesterase